MKFNFDPRPRMPVIKCAVCKKPVERVEWFDDKPGGRYRTIRAHCHGAVDSMRLDMSIKQEVLDALAEVEGVAFEVRKASSISLLEQRYEAANMLRSRLSALGGVLQDHEVSEADGRQAQPLRLTGPADEPDHG